MINVTVENVDIATDPDTGLILDVTAADDATPADYIDMYSNGTIRYGFLVAVPEGMTAQISVTLAGAPAPEEHTVTFVADGVTVETVTVADGEVLPAADFPAVP